MSLHSRTLARVWSIYSSDRLDAGTTQIGHTLHWILTIITIFYFKISYQEESIQDQDPPFLK